MVHDFLKSLSQLFQSLKAFEFPVFCLAVFNMVDMKRDIYLLLTEFEVRTVSYGSSFFPPSICGPSAKSAGHKSKGKKRGSVTYSRDRKDEVSKIFIISLLCA